MTSKVLFNKKSREILFEELENESFKRITGSFYYYKAIKDPAVFRDKLYAKWATLNVLGRTYVAPEGINSQFSCPEYNWINFKSSLEAIGLLKNLSLKTAIEEGQSFYKLIVKVKDEIVAYRIDENEYDLNKVGAHLSAKDFNEKLEKSNTVVVDMRNYYESEVGRFENAILPNVDTSRELLPEVKKILKGHEDDEVLLYCTGGIRCEKASAFLIKNGFNYVNQLNGGIIQYAHDIKKNNLKSKFKGKNFVFDARMGERITGDIIGQCHQCDNSADDHIDCSNDACHILFIQCSSCRKKYNGCCSIECKDFSSLPLEKQRSLRKDPNKVVSKIRYSSRARPRFNEM